MRFGIRAAVVILVASLAGCSSVSSPESMAFGLVFAPEAGTGCASQPVGTHKLPTDVDWLVARLLDSGGAETAGFAVQASDLESGDGQVLLKKIPPGSYTFQVVGCRNGSSGPEATWQGETRGVVVQAGQKAAPVVFLTRAGALSCVGAENQHPFVPQFDGDGFLVNGRTAFGAGAVTDSGRIIVAGGFSEYRAKDDTLTAGKVLWEFHPDTGVFLRIPRADETRLDLEEARAMHGLFPVGGEILIAVGGVRSATINPIGPPGTMLPVLPKEPVNRAVEVIQIDKAVAHGVKINAGAAFLPSVAVGSQWIALAGGVDGPNGAPSRTLSLVAADIADLLDDKTKVRSETLMTPRVGGVARFLSTGELLLIGGWTGEGPAAPELVRILETAVDSVALSLPGGRITPEFVDPTAFPSVHVLKDDGASIKIAILGGNPVSALPVGIQTPMKTDFWVMSLSVVSGKVDPTSFQAAAVPTQGDWSVRSMASLVAFGHGFLALGGYRSFREEADVPDCKDAWGFFCFPKSLAAFGFDAALAELAVQETTLDDTARLGATTLPFGNGRVLVLGGLNGYGFPREGKKIPTNSVVLSTGYVAVESSQFDAKICADHPPTVAPVK